MQTWISSDLLSPQSCSVFLIRLINKHPILTNKSFFLPCPASFLFLLPSPSFFSFPFSVVSKEGYLRSNVKAEVLHYWLLVKVFLSIRFIQESKRTHCVVDKHAASLLYLLIKSQFYLISSFQLGISSNTLCASKRIMHLKT